MSYNQSNYAHSSNYNHNYNNNNQMQPILQHANHQQSHFNHQPHQQTSLTPQNNQNIPGFIRLGGFDKSLFQSEKRKYQGCLAIKLGPVELFWLRFPLDCI